MSDTKPDRKKYHHGNLRQALIDAGLEILARDGLAGISLRSCAERAGVSHAAPKNHFGNLGGLLTAIAARGYAMLLAAAQRGMVDGASRVARRNAAIEGYVGFATAHPALYELMFSQHQIDRQDPALLAELKACFALLAEISEGLDWDKADAPDAVLRTQLMLWSFLHGYSQLSLSGRLDKDSLRGLGVLDVLPGFPYRA